MNYLNSLTSLMNLGNNRDSLPDLYKQNTTPDVLLLENPTRCTPVMSSRSTRSSVCTSPESPQTPSSVRRNRPVKTTSLSDRHLEQEESIIGYHTLEDLKLVQEYYSEHRNSLIKL